MSKPNQGLLKPKPEGVLAWMATNPVASNLFMVLLLVGGLAMSLQLKQEVFPEVELDVVTIQVPYPGASPSEVEQGAVLAIEEAVRGLDGIKKVSGTARESLGIVTVELLLGADRDRALADVKAAVDRIVSFPEEAERPVVQLVANRSEVVSLIVYGDVSEKTIRTWAERAREDLLQDPDVTQIELLGARPLEIAVEVSQDRLREFNLTHDQLAGLIRQSSLELPGGGIKTEGGEILVRTAERKNVGQEFGEIIVLSRPDGTQVRLKDIAEVKDGFRETDEMANYEGKRAIMVRVFRVADQTPIEVSDAVKKYVSTKEGDLPPGINFALWNDQSEIYRQRIDLLLDNAYLGLILVFFCLGLFLNFRLAFWVMLGIPISFLGAMLLLPITDVSINMISLFAFIVTLGIVVDDAIVVGENIYSWRQKTDDLEEAAIKGVQEIAMPVLFSVTTTVVAFSPMLFVPGVMGKLFSVIPTIVIAVLVLSLFESLLILPAHLAHRSSFGAILGVIVGAMVGGLMGHFYWEVLYGIAAGAAVGGVLGLFFEGVLGGVLETLENAQGWFSNKLEQMIANLYAPVVKWSLQYRYVVLAVGVTMLLFVFGLMAGGRIGFTFFPKIDGDVVQVKVRLPVGAPIETAEAFRGRLESSARRALDEMGGQELSRGIFAQLGRPFAQGGPGGGGIASTGSHIVEMAVFMVPSDERGFTAAAFSEVWRRELGELTGVDSLVFVYSIGPSAGSAIDIQLSHPDVETLETAASTLAESLNGFPGVKDIEDGVLEGKPQLDFTLTPAGRSLGLTATDMARQLRAAFFGSEALRQQRGRDEVRVMVRLPEKDRESSYALEQFLLRSPSGGEISLAQAASITKGRAYTEIKRVNGRRVVNVTADVGDDGPTPNEIIRSVDSEVVPGLLRRYPQLRYSLEGEQREQRETLGSLLMGLIMAMMIIYALLAIPFKSYSQPLIIMSAIPFGFVGAALGHLMMGYSLSIMSMMGIVALSGIVVNDSLVLIVTVNREREDGKPLHEAVISGSQRRFRPIVLTSLTTFFGLAPMMLETSVQARFLIPMAISLAFGVIFATFIILIMVPSFYVVLEDFKRIASTLYRFVFRGGDAEPEEVEEPAPELDGGGGVQGTRL